jgi:hypothetical protein
VNVEGEGRTSSVQGVIGRMRSATFPTNEHNHTPAKEEAESKQDKSSKLRLLLQIAAEVASQRIIVARTSKMRTRTWSVQISR